MGHVQTNVIYHQSVSIVSEKMKQNKTQNQTKPTNKTQNTSNKIYGFICLYFNIISSTNIWALNVALSKLIILSKFLELFA